MIEIKVLETIYLSKETDYGFKYRSMLLVYEASNPTHFWYCQNIQNPSYKAVHDLIEGGSLYLSPDKEEAIKILFGD